MAKRVQVIPLHLLTGTPKQKQRRERSVNGKLATAQFLLRSWAANPEKLIGIVLVLLQLLVLGVMLIIFFTSDPRTWHWWQWFLWLSIAPIFAIPIPTIHFSYMLASNQRGMVPVLFLFIHGTLLLGFFFSWLFSSGAKL